MRILIVEDEEDLNRILQKHLKKEGYSVDGAFDGEEAMDYLAVGDYDLIIADIMMPKKDGFSLIQDIRKQGKMTPVLFLTARDAVEDRVRGLDLGADDYLVKPFEFAELLARVRALIRRQYGSADTVLQAGDLIVNTADKTVERGGIPISLTAKEYEILAYLMMNQGKIISKEQLHEHVWDFDYDGFSNSLEVLIKNIRKKINVGDSKPLIHTRRGLGYVLRSDDNEK